MIRDRSIVRDWPASLIEVAEVIGVKATLHLVEAFGGTTLYVPEHLDPSHRLAQAIGFNAAEQLVSMYRLEKIEVPTMRIVRTRKALIGKATGTTNQIAREFGVTTRWVRMVRNFPTDNDPRQTCILDFISKSAQK